MAQDIDESWIELGAGCNPENSERNVVAHDTHRNAGNMDGIEGVGDRKYPGSKGDESPSDAIGVPGAVPSFVVMRNENGGLTQE